MINQDVWMHKMLTIILYNFIVTLIYIANTIHWWRAVFGCVDRGNACSGSYNVRVHLPCEGTMANLPGEGTMAHLPGKGTMAYTQKQVFFFQLNGQVHVLWWGCLLISYWQPSGAC